MIGFQKPWIVAGVKCVVSVIDTWDRFWFSPRSNHDLDWIRIILGTLSAVYVLTWLPNIGNWLSDDGLLSKSQVEFLIGRGVPGTGSEGRLSPLFTLIPPSLAWVYVLLTSLICVAVAFGLGGRFFIVIAWAMLLGLVHRVPMLQGPGDLLIVGLFGYLVVCPYQTSWRIQNPFVIRESQSHCQSSWLGNLAFRLIQCHVFLWFAASLSSHLAEPMWWTGDAPWWLSFSGDRSWISMRFWLDHPYLMNLTAYLIVGLQAWIVLSFLVPNLRTSGIVAMIGFALVTLIVSNEWIYSIAILGCSYLLIPREDRDQGDLISTVRR